MSYSQLVALLALAALDEAMQKPRRDEMSSADIVAEAHRLIDDFTAFYAPPMALGDLTGDPELNYEIATDRARKVASSVFKRYHGQRIKMDLFLTEVVRALCLDLAELCDEKIRAAKSA